MRHVGRGVSEGVLSLDGWQPNPSLPAGRVVKVTSRLKGMHLPASFLSSRGNCVAEMRAKEVKHHSREERFIPSVKCSGGFLPNT